MSAPNGSVARVFFQPWLPLEAEGQAGHDLLSRRAFRPAAGTAENVRVEGKFMPLGLCRRRWVRLRPLPPICQSHLEAPRSTQTRACPTRPVAWQHQAVRRRVCPLQALRRVPAALTVALIKTK